MNRQTKHSGMFLLELMIAILFFCMASAVCIRLFVKSHTISQDTQNLNMALNQVTMAAEIFRSRTDMQEFFRQEVPYYEERSDGTEFFLYYDKKWENCKEKDASFCLKIKSWDKGNMKTGNFSMVKADTGKEIYSLSLETFTGE